MFEWLNEESRTFLERGYLQDGVTPEQRIKQIAEHAQSILGYEGFADKFFDYMSKGWFSLSTPVWCNFGLDRGLPISCFGSYINDSVDSIMYTSAEIGMMSKYGGGTSAYFGKVRGRGEKIKNNGESSGSVHFMRMFDTLIDIVNQGSARRGSLAVYQDVEHKDIEEFLEIKKEGNPIQNLFTGVCVGDEWLSDMINGDMEKRLIWAKVLESRSENGVPYIIFRDNANNNKPQVYKDKGMDIHASNLCSEIFLPSNETESFVCCLSSINLLHYDEWKDTDAVEVLTFFLDAVMEEFIQKSENLPFMERPHNFAKNHRALGLGVLGWHSLLQSKMIPFEGLASKRLNKEVFRLLDEKTMEATKKLAEDFGEPEVLKGYGQRNTTRLAIAPTTSSAFILGQVSQSIEPLRSNYYIKELAKRKFVCKNKFLEKLLEEKGLNDRETWLSIMKNDGSVQHLSELSQEEKDVFKTFKEISQLEVIQQAAQRQEHIDQGQSLNIMIHPVTPTRELNGLILEAHKLGIKGLYYQHSINAAQEFSQSLMSCTSCEA